MAIKTPWILLTITFMLTFSVWGENSFPYAPLPKEIPQGYTYTKLSEAEKKHLEIKSNPGYVSSRVAALIARDFRISSKKSPSMFYVDVSLESNRLGYLVFSYQNEENMLQAVGNIKTQFPFFYLKKDVVIFHSSSRDLVDITKNWMALLKKRIKKEKKSKEHHLKIKENNIQIDPKIMKKYGGAHINLESRKLTYTWDSSRKTDLFIQPQQARIEGTVFPLLNKQTMDDIIRQASTKDGHKTIKWKKELKWNKLEAIVNALFLVQTQNKKILVVRINKINPTEFSMQLSFASISKSIPAIKPYSFQKLAGHYATKQGKKTAFVYIKNHKIFLLLSAWPMELTPCFSNNTFFLSGTRFMCAFKKNDKGKITKLSVGPIALHPKGTIYIKKIALEKVKKSQPAIQSVTLGDIDQIKGGFSFKQGKISAHSYIFEHFEFT